MQEKFNSKAIKQKLEWSGLGRVKKYQPKAIQIVGAVPSHGSKQFYLSDLLTIGLDVI